MTKRATRSAAPTTKSRNAKVPRGRSRSTAKAKPKTKARAKAASRATATSLHSKPDPHASTMLDAIFRPKSVAVVGATNREHQIGRVTLRNLVEGGFNGPVYPVNIRGAVVNSMRAYKSVGEIDPAPDLAVIVVPRDAVLPVLKDCGKAGVKGIVTITAGFKEVNEEGAELERQILKTLQKYGMRMVGPNCVGVINTEPDVSMNASFVATQPVPGNVGFISQSGALGEAILANAGNSGLGVSMFVSMGNKTDVSGNDLLEYWEDNDSVKVILMYLESFGNPKRFTNVARRVTRKKPVLTVKSGRTAAGARAASSHTGSIVELDVATESLLEQCGVLRVSSLEEMFEKASALSQQPIPKGDRFAILTNAGGPAILCTDALVSHGLVPAELTKTTENALRKVLPPEASVHNPVDMIASANADSYRASLAAIKKDPHVDAIIAIFVSPIMIDAYEIARAVADAADGVKPILCVFMGKQRSEEGLAELRTRNVPVYSFPEQAASGLAAMCRYRKLRDEPIGERITYDVDAAAARKIVKGARQAGRLDLTPAEVAQLLEAYDFPLAPARTVSAPAAAIAASQELGYPVVLKIASDVISHKTDVGGVKVDLRNADEVGAAYREMTERLQDEDPNLRVTVQKMVGGGQELIFGVLRDKQFGPLMMVGMGGVHVEILRDVAVNVHPLTDHSAETMVQKLRGYPLLTGARGAKPVNLALIQECLLRLSQLVADLDDELAELDLNPFIVTADRDRSFVVDARARLTRDDER